MKIRIGVILALAVVGTTLAASAAGNDAKVTGESTRIVWSRVNATGTRQKLVSARPDGSKLKQLTHPSKGAYDIDAQISLDGAEVAYERDTHRGNAAKIRLVETNGTNDHAVDLGCTDPCVVDAAPTWVPAGDRIIFTPVVGPFDAANDSARSAVLYTALLNGSNVQRLSVAGIDGKFEDYHAHYSPGGSYIVFTRVRNKPLDVATFRMNADGSGVRRLTPWSLDADLADLSPATSGPTKDLIVFETYGMGAPKGKQQDIATVPATCTSASACRTQIRYVTHNDGAGPVASFNPAWSPAGDRIAFTKFKNGGPHDCCVGDIWTARPDGSHRKAVSTSPLFEYRPDWGIAP